MRNPLLTTQLHRPEVYGDEPSNAYLDEVRTAALLYNSYGWESDRIAETMRAHVEDIRSYFRHPYFRAFAVVVYERGEYDADAIIKDLADVDVDLHRIARLFGVSLTTMRERYTRTFTPRKRRSLAIRTGQLSVNRSFQRLVAEGKTPEEIKAIHEVATRASLEVINRAIEQIRQRGHI
jgi:hypothetical protein